MKKKLLDNCMDLARKKNNPSHPQFTSYLHYSFVIQNNKIIEWGMNVAGTVPGYKDYMKIHSEYMAYKRAKGLLDKRKSFVMINIRLNRQGLLKMSKPCPCCSNWLPQVGCSKVFYTTQSGFESLTFGRI